MLDILVLTIQVALLGSCVSVAVFIWKKFRKALTFDDAYKGRHVHSFETRDENNFPICECGDKYMDWKTPNKGKK